MKPLNCFLGLLVTELIVILGGFGISCWLFAQVPDSRNVLAMVPICFTGFAVLVSLIGILGGKCHNTCLLITHIAFGIICIIGFAAVCIMSGMWLGGESFIMGDANTNQTVLRSVCANQTIIDAIQNSDENDVQDTIAELEVSPEFESILNEIQDYVSFCRFEDVAFDLIFGKTEESSLITINTMIAICSFCGVSFLLYATTGILGCIFMKEIKSYGWSA